jgi:hypothetical protein
MALADRAFGWRGHWCGGGGGESGQERAHCSPPAANRVAPQGGAAVSDFQAFLKEVLAALCFCNFNSALFYASMIPSIWLWIYTASIGLTRVVLKGRPLWSRLMWLLDIEKTPLRSIGIVAGALTFAGVALLLVATELARALLAQVGAPGPA